MPRLVWLACAILVGASSEPGPAAPAAAAPLSPAAVVAALETALGDAIARAEPSVVAIAREKPEDGDEATAIRGRGPVRDQQLDIRNGLREVGPFGEDPISFDYGSGVVIGDRGEILTAYHVVKGASRLSVRAVDRQAFDGEIIAADPRSDLAVIVPKEVPGLAAPKLKPIALGDASTLRKGAFLVALGNPYNAARDGRPSASWGILSNVARRLVRSPEESSRQAFNLRNHPTLLQLDSKLNLGMSGGAVINLKGELVGLTTAIANAAGYDAQAGYAIPLDALGRRIVETLKQGKEYEHGLLGIQLDPGGTNKVLSAQPGTPASEGGVQTGDTILAVGDIPVSDGDSLVLAVESYPAGSAVKLKLLRHGEVLTPTIELAKRKLDEPIIATNRPAPWRGLRVDFTSTMPHAVHDPETHEALSRGGVAVAEVAPGSPSDRAGLKTDQVITHVEGRRVRSPREFAAAVAEPKGPVSLTTNRGPVIVK